jgi:hypothetical protein
MHSDLEVSVSLVAPRKGTCYIDAHLFERDPDFVLMHLALVSLGAVALVRGAAVGDLPIPDAALSLFPIEYALCPGRSAVPISEQLFPIWSRLQTQ